jgi:allantoin racemase
MLLHVVNPNTTRAMTDLVGGAARAVAGVGTTIVASNPAMGPASIESHYDEALAVPGLLAEIAAAERGDAGGPNGTGDPNGTGRPDGYIVACFGDPGLYAARELASGPVVGIAEAAMHAAVLLGRSFSVVTTLSRTTGRAWDLANQYGFGDHCASVLACDVPVLELDDPSSDAARLVEDLARRAIDDDGADSIVLGCAGMASFCQRLGERLGVPVIDGVSAATLMVESLVRMRLTTSRRDEFARPLPKRYGGLLESFALERAPLPGRAN